MAKKKSPLTNNPTDINVKALAVWQTQNKSMCMVNIVGVNNAGNLVYSDTKFIPLTANKRYAVMEVNLKEDVEAALIEKEKAEVAATNRRNATKKKAGKK